MFDKWRKYSYSAQKRQRHRLLYVLVWICSLFGAYVFVSNFMVNTIVLQNQTMRPGLADGDRFIVHPFGFHRAVSALLNRGDGGYLPFKRGALVLVAATDQGQTPNLLRRTIGALLRFFTAQMLDLTGRENRLHLKRVIGLPGDEISMTDYVLKIKSADAPYALTEFELAAKPYDVLIPQIPPLWDQSLPFSGTMAAQVLAADECFVVSDDRSVTSDSRTWGPVAIKSIVGKTLFRYWPFRRIGVP